MKETPKTNLLEEYRKDRISLRELKMLCPDPKIRLLAVKEAKTYKNKLPNKK